jgi:hypothetical protein
MSYIIKNTNPFVSIKLTEQGREKLAQGKLNFSYWAIGDSEINYDRESIVDAAAIAVDLTLSATTRIMRPVDRQPNFKSFITRPTDIEPYQPLTTANMNVIKAIVNNEAIERGFFTYDGTGYTTNSTTTYSNYNQSLPLSGVSGSTSLILTNTSTMKIGDLILLKLPNDITGNIVYDENTRPLPNLWFKVQDIPTAGELTLDRNLPNYSAHTAMTEVLVYRGGEVYETIATGNTTAYWDSGTLSFDSASNITCHDVPVWNMNNIFCETLAGVTGLTSTNLYEDYTKYGSYDYLGAKNPYFEYLCQESGTTLLNQCSTPGLSYLDSISKSISVIHYTNNAISNLYGEFFYVDATNNKMVSIVIPDLMYHRANYSTASGTTMGMKFLASGTTQMVGSSDIEYIDLIEDPAYLNSAATPMAIGRVYPQLKTIVIHNDDIIAAMSYKSNRNWTLPELSATLSAPSGGTSTGILGINETMYLSYSLENVNGTTGLTSSLPCQSYIKITNDSVTPKDIQFKINQTDLLPYMRKIENVGYDGLGFYAKKFKLLYQTVADSNLRPEAGSWKVLDFTSTAITGISGETINPILLENQIPTVNGFELNVINDASATTFNLIDMLSLAPNYLPENLQFGDERFFYGNLNTYIGATVYKTIFNVNVNSATYNTTTNTTRSKDLTTNPPNIKITEVGIYDTDKNLVSVGKLSTPIALASNTITLELSMDF